MKEGEGPMTLERAASRCLSVDGKQRCYRKHPSFMKELFKELRAGRQVTVWVDEPGTPAPKAPRGRPKKAERGKPKTPRLDLLNRARRAFKEAATCKAKKTAFKEVVRVLNEMATAAPNTKKGESAEDARTRRKTRFEREIENKRRDWYASCGTGLLSEAPKPVKSKKAGGHPCAGPNPPAWCRK